MLHSADGPAARPATVLDPLHDPMNPWTARCVRAVSSDLARVPEQAASLGMMSDD